MQEIVIGSVVIDPSARGDKEDCIFLFPDGLEGHYGGGMSDRGERVARAYGDGDLSLDGFLSSGALNLRGGMTARTPEALVYKIQRFTAEFTSKEIVVSLRDESGRFWRTARRVALPKVTRHGRDLCYATFEAELRFPDPFYYGETRTYRPGERAVNKGNAPATPRIKVTGPYPPYTVTDGLGHEIATAMTLPAGGVDVIDLSTGWLTRAGAVVSGGIAKFDPWKIPAFGSVVHTFNGPSEQIVIEVTDTYM